MKTIPLDAFAKKIGWKVWFGDVSSLHVMPNKLRHSSLIGKREACFGGAETSIDHEWLHIHGTLSYRNWEEHKNIMGLAQCKHCGEIIISVFSVF